MDMIITTTLWVSIKVITWYMGEKQAMDVTVPLKECKKESECLKYKKKGLLFTQTLGFAEKMERKIKALCFPPILRLNRGFVMVLDFKMIIFI